MTAVRNIFGAFAVLLPLDFKFMSVDQPLPLVWSSIFVGLNLYLTEVTVCLNFFSAWHNSP